MVKEQVFPQLSLVATESSDRLWLMEVVAPELRLMEDARREP